MRTRTLLSAVIASALLFGCSTVPTDPKMIVGRAPPPETFFNTVNCSADGCIVKISVTGDCTFDVPAIVRLSGTHGAIHGIIWVIQSKDYVFSTATGAPSLVTKGSGDFFGNTAVIGRLLAIEVKVASPNQSHEYGLNIARRSGGACRTVDPFLIE